MIKKLLWMMTLLSIHTLSFANLLGFATIETSSFLTSTGQQVVVGDSLNQLMSKTAQSPSAIKTGTWTHVDQKLNAMIYEYDIGQRLYSVTVVHEQVLKIKWQEKPIS